MDRTRQRDLTEARAVARWFERRSDPRVRGSEPEQHLADVTLKRVLEEQLGMSPLEAQVYVRDLFEAYRRAGWI